MEKNNKKGNMSEVEIDGTENKEKGKYLEEAWRMEYENDSTETSETTSEEENTVNKKGEKGKGKNKKEMEKSRGVKEEEEKRIRQQKEEDIKRQKEEDIKRQKEEDAEIMEEIKQRKARDERQKERERREKEEELKKKEEEDQQEEKETRNRSEGTAEQNMNEIKKNMNVIKKAISKETANKISFTRGDQAIVRGALVNIYEEFLDFMVKHSELVNEKFILKEKCRDLENKLGNFVETRGSSAQESENEGDIETRPEVSEPRNVRDRERESESEESERDEGAWTYAQRVRRGMRGRGRGITRGAFIRREQERERREGEKQRVGNEERSRDKERKGWSTPPPNPEIIVTKENESNARKLVQELQNRVKSNVIGGPPKAVRYLRDGKVSIVAQDMEQRERILKEVRKIEGVEARKTKSKDPMIEITGVNVDLEERELLECIRRENNELTDTGMKIIKKRNCRNAWKMNVVIQMETEGFKRIIRKGKVNVNYESHIIEEFFDVEMCFKCCRYGHVAKWCAGDIACYNCGGRHEARECKIRNKGCINCKRVFGRNEQHGARDFNCPVRKQNTEKAKKYINYDN